MAKEYATHKFCDHADTSFDRWKCRAKKRHEECDHKQNVSQWRKCEEAARSEAKES